MAEGTQQGWWSSLIQTAKEKSVNAIDFVKKDLVEFQSTMKTDTTKIATGVKEKISSENAIAATQKAKEGVSSIFGGITKVLTVEAEDKRIKKVHLHPAKQIFDRSKARVNAIQVDPDTYIAEPSGSEEEFEDWLKTFNLDNKKGQISELLVIHVEVRALYTQLVPSQVSHAAFWQRYFYKMHQLEKDEKRKAALMKRADDVQEEVGWDDEDDWCDLEGPSSPPRQSGMHLAAKVLSRVEDLEEPDVMDTTPQSSEESETSAATSEQTEVTAEQVSRVGSSENIETDTEKKTATATSSKNDSVDGHSKPENVTPKLSELKIDSAGACHSTESSLSISSSLTDSLKPMESSADTLTMVSPLEEVPSEQKSTMVEVSQNVPEPVEPAVVESKEASPPCTDVKSDNSSMEVIESSSEEEIKTRIKGDLVVVGSGVSSDTTTPASSESSNKEADDDWEREFEVSEDDLKLIQTKTTPQTEETNNEENEDDWESWD